MTNPASRPSVTIPLPSEEIIGKIIGEGYDPAKTLNVIKMFAGAGDLYAAADGMVKAIFSEKSIDAKLREMIIIRAARVMHCSYAQAIGPVIGRNTGLTGREISAADGEDPVTGIDPEYVLLCRATDELSTQATLTDSTLAEMMERYDLTTCRKLILTICWFNLVNRFENGCRVPDEAPGKIAHMASPI